MMRAAVIIITACSDEQPLAVCPQYKRIVALAAVRLRSHRAGLEDDLHIFVKPELVIIYDRLEAKESSTYEYWLHAINKIEVQNQHKIQVQNDDVVCDIDFLTPADLSFTQTDQYDPNPRPRIKLREWHLTATTPDKSNRLEFVTLYRPHRERDKIDGEATLNRIPGGYILSASQSGKKLTALLPTDDTATLEANGLKTTGAIKLKLEQPDKPPQILEVQQGILN